MDVREPTVTRQIATRVPEKLAAEFEAIAEVNHRSLAAELRRLVELRVEAQRAGLGRAA